MKSTRPLSLFAIAIAAISIANAQDTTVVPEGSASRISDWALSGVIWSDASLTKKLARQAMQDADSPEQVAQFTKLYQQSSRIVEAMEAYGWKQVKRIDNSIDGDSPVSSDGRKALIDPKEVDPGIVDARNGGGLVPDVDNYIDETTADARSRAAAIQAGVQRDTAAAPGPLGLGTRAGEYSSFRDAQTRTAAVLPFSRHSIYDFDDDENARIDTIARDKRLAPEPIVSTEATPVRHSRTDLNRYSSERSKYGQDANWVQFHLDANQAVWTKFTTQENLNRRLSDSLTQLRADVSVAIQATDNEQLKNILSQVQ